MAGLRSELPFKAPSRTPLPGDPGEEPDLDPPGTVKLTGRVGEGGRMATPLGLGEVDPMPGSLNPIGGRTNGPMREAA